ncbi:MAG: S8 family peptidase, partial [Lentisphaerae bacterium]|nr:S8 family peptidase [Lentisphaerota bacterium]
MPNQTERKKRHFILEGFAQTERFIRPRQIIAKTPVTEQDRRRHGTALLNQIAALKPILDTARRTQESIGFEGGFGLQVEFESFPDIDLAFESLSRENQGIELFNVRHDEHLTYATVFVPDGKLDHFENLIRDYLDEKRDSRGRARDHKALVNTIQQIRTASLRALWTDDPGVFPATDDETFWWEVWLPIRDDRTATVANFHRLADSLNFHVAKGVLAFPERTVLLVHTSAAVMRRSMMMLNSIAELRRAKETAEFFDSLQPEEQPAWMDELLNRCRFPQADDAVPYVCLLDTGVNNGHPLLAPALANSDLHTVEPSWGIDDTAGHGTAMAGLALAGDLTAALSSSKPIVIGHRLESVKLLPAAGENIGNSQHHGYLTMEAVARAEISNPYRQRVFGMAVTARDNRDRGRPSAWSATVDRLATDADGDAANARLLVVSAGNVVDPSAWAESPVSNSSDSIHDPAQAWNALTVGAYTDLVHITEMDASDYRPITQAGGLSPFSTTSVTWQPHWPLKPDVLFEGGNAAQDGLGAVWLHSLSLLTTHHLPEQRLFTTANATSAAMALAAHMASQLMAAYPTLWPESIRGLIVHSAEWTEAMRRTFLPTKPKPLMSDYARLIRHCGFGVPDLERALWSVSNSLTLLEQAQLHPFQREGTNQPTLRDMNLHRLPWPQESLEALGETLVEMRVTLSYFIEPNPSERGFRSRY